MKIISFLTLVLLTSCAINDPCGKDKDQFLYNFHKFNNGTATCDFDLNRDGVIDAIDLILFGEDFGRNG